MVPYCEWNEREIGLFGSIPQSWKSQAFTHMLSLSPTENTIGRYLRWFWAVPPLGKGDAGKVKLFLLPFPVYSDLSFFAPMVCWNFIRKQDFHKSSHPWVTKSVFSRGSQTMVEANSQDTEGSTSGTEICMPIFWGTSRQDLSQAPLPMVLDPAATSHFCLWIDAELLLSLWHEQRTSYFAILLMSLPKKRTVLPKRL